MTDFSLKMTKLRAMTSQTSTRMSWGACTNFWRNTGSQKSSHSIRRECERLFPNSGTELGRLDGVDTHFLNSTDRQFESSV